MCIRDSYSFSDNFALQYAARNLPIVVCGNTNGRFLFLLHVNQEETFLRVRRKVTTLNIDGATKREEIESKY